MFYSFFFFPDESGMRRTSSVPDQRSLLDKRPDPVREVWPDMLVKIADLGNACWVVSGYELMTFPCGVG